MIQKTLGAAVAALLLLSTAAAAEADIIQTRDGQWWPKKIQKLMEGREAPPDPTLRKSGRNNLELGYDKVTISGQTFNAADVIPGKIFCTTAYENAHYRNGEVQALSGAWPEAAASMGEAAEALKGAAKQQAMWLRVQFSGEANMVAQTFDGAQQLLDAFPRTWWYANVQNLRARVLLIRKKRGEAEQALDKVLTAPGMNAKDYFQAKLDKIYLFMLKTAGTTKARVELARLAFEQIVSEIDGRIGAKKHAYVQRLKAVAYVGICLVYEEEFEKARPKFKSVIDSEESLEDQSLLAIVYRGLGDVKYASVKKDLAGGELKDEQLPKVVERLTDAALDYLRVAKFYVESAGDELYPATVGIARVWATQFTLTGEKDCELAKRASKFFYAAHKLLPRGEQQRLLTREAKRFFAKRDEACKVPGKK